MESINSFVAVSRQVISHLIQAQMRSIDSTTHLDHPDEVDQSYRAHRTTLLESKAMEAFDSVFLEEDSTIIPIGCLVELPGQRKGQYSFETY